MEVRDERKLRIFHLFDRGKVGEQHIGEIKNSYIIVIHNEIEKI